MVINYLKTTAIVASKKVKRVKFYSTRYKIDCHKLTETTLIGFLLLDVFFASFDGFFRGGYGSPV